MNKTKLMVVGGFLGAGKTTAIIEIAKRLLKNGKKIGIVTNDQGSRLVDSEYMKSQGLPVLEVTGGCFCCNFDEFTNKLAIMSEEYFPDIVLAEPVGSCTDLVATIMKPIKKGFAGKFALSPLSIVVDPKRLKRVMKDTGFTNEINYLFNKQIEEASVITLGKIDTLTKDEINEYVDFLKSKYPNAYVLCASAKTGEGMDQWINKITVTGDFNNDSLDIEYDKYATAEALLGWLNTTAGINPNSSLDANEFLEKYADKIKAELKNYDMEIAHLKLYIVSNLDYAKLSLVSIHENVCFDKKMGIPCKESSLIINIRAATNPEYLEEITINTLNELAKEFDFSLMDVQTDCFSPSYPNPIHRL